MATRARRGSGTQAAGAIAAGGASGAVASGGAAASASVSAAGGAISGGEPARRCMSAEAFKACMAGDDYAPADYENITVEGVLKFIGDESWKPLPKGLKVRGLRVKNCAALKTLPEGLDLGRLSLEECSGIEALPAGLKVRNLDIISCHALKGFPEDLAAEACGKIEIRGCSQAASMLATLNYAGYLEVMNCSLETLPLGLGACRRLKLDVCKVKAIPEGFEAKGDLILGDVETMPRVLKVEGELRLEGEFGNLPEQIDVGRDCTLSCFGAEALPSKMIVGGSLRVAELEGVTSLTGTWQVEGSMCVAGCDTLEEIGVGAKIGGDLKIENCRCRALKICGKDSHVKGNLCVEKCGELESLVVDGAFVDGDVSFEECGSLKVLSSGEQPALTVGGNLSLKNCKKFEGLPDGLVVHGNLDLRGCTSLVSMPAGLRVTGDLLLDGCSALAELPAGLKVGGDLLLDGCSALAELPAGLKVGGDLELANCINLVSLPKGLRVGGRLSLMRCHALAALPKGLQVGGDLELVNCINLVSLPEGLRVGGSLSLMRCHALAALPKGLQVGGDLILIENGQIEVLPEDIRIGKNLTLSEYIIKTLPPSLNIAGSLSLLRCDSLTELPEGLVVGKRLGICDCQAMTKLPKRCEVGKVLIIKDCRYLKTLPAGLILEQLSLKDCAALTDLPGDLAVADLEIERCHALVGVPDGVTVSRRLSVNDCRNFSLFSGKWRLQSASFDFCPNLNPTELVELWVAEGFHINGCQRWEKLPEGLWVGEKCSLIKCDALKGLPPDFVVLGDFEMEKCHTVPKIPADASLGANITVEECNSFTTFPDGLEVNGDFIVEKNPRLVQFPVGLKVEKHFFARYCSGLESFKGGFEVGGDFGIQRCESLAALPVFRVGGDFGVADCDSFLSFSEAFGVGGGFTLNSCRRALGLPISFDIGGDITLEHCPAVTALPSRLFELGLSSDGKRRNVFLRHTGLSANLITRLMETEAAGMQIHVSLPRVDVTPFPNLEAALAFWNEFRAEGDPDLELDFTAWAMDGDQRDELLGFLSRLKATAECKNTRTRAGLARRVLHALRLMNEDTELRGQCLGIISAALVTCDDRIIQGMGQVEMGIRLFEANRAEATEGELRSLALSIMRLEVVHKKAAEKVASLVWVDEVEVYLAYETKLAEALGLPVSTSNMIFERFSQVTDEDIAAARAAAEAITDEEFEAYLEAWSPWQKFSRRKVAAELTWEAVAYDAEDLSAERKAAFAESSCCICSEDFADLKEPVYLAGDSSNAVFEFDALMEWYVEKGTHPLPPMPEINLANLRRAKAPEAASEAAGAGGAAAAGDDG